MLEDLKKEETREKLRLDMILEGLKKITKYKDLKLEKITDKELQKLGCDVAICVNNEIKAFADYKHLDNNYIVLELINIKQNNDWYKGYPYLNDYGWAVDNNKKTQFIIYTTDDRIVMFNYYKLRKYVQDNLYKFLTNANITNTTEFENNNCDKTKQKSYAFRGLFEAIGHRKNDKLIDELIKKVGCWIYNEKTDIIETINGTMRLSEQDEKIKKNNFKDLKTMYLNKKNTSESAKIRSI